MDERTNRGMFSWIIYDVIHAFDLNMPSARIGTYSKRAGSATSHRWEIDSRQRTYTWLSILGIGLLSNMFRMSLLNIGRLTPITTTHHQLQQLTLIVRLIMIYTLLTVPRGDRESQQLEVEKRS